MWLLCSSLLVTLFPATVALFAVFRAWQENPNEAFYLPFLAHMRGRFGGDFVLGLVWLLLAALLLLNAALLPRLPPPARAPAFALLALTAVLYAAASVFLAPLRVVRTSLGLWASARAALILGMTQLGTTALSVLALVLAGVLFWVFPPSLLVSGIAVGHLTFRLCDRRLKRLFT